MIVEGWDVDASGAVNGKNDDDDDGENNEEDRC
jgi:hypothetical protein